MLHTLTATSFIPLIYSPSEDARATLKIEIALCKHESNQNEAIYDLGVGDMYFEYLIRFFCKSGSKCYILNTTWESLIPIISLEKVYASLL